MTAGINAITFGNFAGSGVWNSPLTLDYFQPQPAPQISLGFYKKQWDISATLFSTVTLRVLHFNDQIKYITLAI
jgi:hypothetical protein